MFASKKEGDFKTPTYLINNTATRLLAWAQTLAEKLFTTRADKRGFIMAS